MEKFLNSQMDLASFWLLLLALALSCCTHNNNLATAVNYKGNWSDQDALFAFKAGVTEDPLGILSTWKESIHFCQWHGVKCGRKHQRVIGLVLDNQNLGAVLSPYLGNLSFLRVLSMKNNSFIQQLPSELGHLRRLQYLELSQNLLVGEIPANLSACSNLLHFSISQNKMAGNIPEALGSLSKLQYCYIAKNKLTGAIPSSLGNLSSLLEFWVSDNRFVGSIPDTLGRLSKLQFFALNKNVLSGTIPFTIFNLTSLTTLSLSFNQIQGILPSDIGLTLPNLVFFSIFINKFTGPIPFSISNMSRLENLDFSINKFVGAVPSLEKLQNLRKLGLSGNLLGNGLVNGLNFLFSLTNISNLTVLGLNNNNFEGVLPVSIANLSTLEIFHLESNHISGGIPRGIINLVNLQDFVMGSNQFSGSIIPDIGNLHGLTQFDLSENKLSGNIPSSLGNLSGLSHLILYQNSFEGNIPSSLGRCKNLVLLSLSQNKLSGNIPGEIFYLPSLSISLNLSYNLLTGPLPLEVGNLRNVQELDVSHNMLSGEIPSTLGSCVRLERLSLQGNSFQGPIPSSLISLRGIQFLDLSQNSFSGKIPQYFADFHLQYLNFSLNDFEGALPNGGIFNNASAVFAIGNPKLCSEAPQMQLLRCKFESSKKNSTLKLKLYLVLGILGVISVLIFLFIYYLYKKTRKEVHLDSLGKSLLRVTYQSLLQATNGFSSDNLIGTGSFGSVYKGILNTDGTIIAVKIFNLLHHAAFQSFIIECQALQGIRHRNVVKVLSVCSSIDHQGNDFKAIIYEFMANGSLEEWLHPDLRTDQAKNLKMLQRLSISIDIANTLDYLHNNQGQTPIVHCDLKPSNVLLDNELVGHLSDFGLSKFIPTASQSFSPSQSSSIGFRGTIGYTAPEYGIGSEVSTQGDIYSFGILLLEMFTGKRPTHDMFKDDYNLRNFVETALPGQVAEIIDQRLLDDDEGAEEGEGEGEAVVASQKIQECSILVFEVGLSCCTESAGDRMSITDVVTQLQFARNVMLGI